MYRLTISQWCGEASTKPISSTVCFELHRVRDAIKLYAENLHTKLAIDYGTRVSNDGPQYLPAEESFRIETFGTMNACNSQQTNLPESRAILLHSFDSWLLQGLPEARWGFVMLHPVIPGMGTCYVVDWTSESTELTIHHNSD